MDTGDIIKSLRKEAGLTQEELGKKLNPPINRAAINKWESGLVENIKRSYIMQLSSIFNVSGSLLMGFNDASQQAPTQPDERTKEIIEMISQLTPQEKELVLAQLRGILASRDHLK